jgi:hypothetical protein
LQIGKSFFQFGRNILEKYKYDTKHYQNKGTDTGKVKLSTNMGYTFEELNQSHPYCDFVSIKYTT